MNQHEKINYIEFPVSNIQQAKDFYENVFAWGFDDYGPEYCAFNNAGIDGGFYLSNLVSQAEQGAMLVVFYSNHLEATLKKIKQANGIISKAIFSFPGGRRFHFTDPSGNEFAVWSDKD